MAKPTTVPRWATGASADVVEPPSGKLDAGWVPGEKAPAQWWNWWRKGVSDWLAYVNGLAGEALTWTAKHTFSAGLATPVAPAADEDVVNKAFAKNAANLTSGTLPAGRIDDAAHGARAGGGLHALATALVDGFLPATDKSKLDNATSSPTASRLLIRDANGRAQFADPAASQDAATKAYADALQFAAPTITVPALNASWTNYTGDEAVGYWKDRLGIVHLRGAAIQASGANTIFTLPAGFRPKASRSAAIVRSDGTPAFASCAVQSDGDVITNPVAIGSVFLLDGVSFLAEQ
jgi:hypothetical protein